MVKKIKGEDGKVYVQKKPFYKKWWFWLLAVIVIGSFAGGGDEEATTEKSTPKSDVSAPVEVATPEAVSSESVIAEEPEYVEPTFGIGQTVLVGDVEFIVNGIETASNVGGEWGKNSQGTFVIVNLTVTNKGVEALSVDDSFFKLMNNGKEYTADGSAGIYANEDTSFFLSSINPDVSMSGKVVFDVSQEVIDSATKQLEVSTGYWGTDTNLINLQ